jgi:alanyl-tRNA synthetase
MGSDITKERLRFDFSFSRKLTKEELQKIEELVNQKIQENLKVRKEEMPLNEALKSGALFVEKKWAVGEWHPEKVSIYTIFNPKTGEIFSKEICAGPHVSETSQLGKFKIQKEGSSGSGVRRIKAILTTNNQQ